MRVSSDEELQRELDEADRDRHRGQAFAFWIAVTVLTLALVAVYPPTRALGPETGWLVATGMGAVVLAYIVKLKVAGPGSSVEVAVAAVLGAVANGTDQWLAGGFSAPFSMLFPLTVLGVSAAVDQGLRRVVLAALWLIAAAPLAYDSFTAAHLMSVIVFGIVLLVLSTLMADYSDRLGAQRLELARREREASNRALTDELTGLANRRALIARLDADDAPASMSAVYLDLNGFKAYNDRFGHAAGDSLLNRRSLALAAAVAEAGQAFRVGGDEFCVLIDGALTRQAPLVERIVESLSERGDDYTIAPSCGVAAVPDDGADARDAMRLADQRMYLEKRAGRGLRGSGLAGHEGELSAEHQLGGVDLRDAHSLGAAVGVDHAIER